MKIPKELEVLAGRIGNATMIAKILDKIPKSSADELELCSILPDRQGIQVKVEGNPEAFTILATDTEPMASFNNKTEKSKTKRIK
jgi:hypothetical protein